MERAVDEAREFQQRLAGSAKRPGGVVADGDSTMREEAPPSRAVRKHGDRRSSHAFTAKKSGFTTP